MDVIGKLFIEDNTLHEVEFIVLLFLLTKHLCCIDKLQHLVFDKKL